MSTLDLTRDLTRQHRRVLVRYLVGLHNDAHLASRLHREAFVHALKGFRNGLQILKPLNVALETSRRAPGRAPDRASAASTKGARMVSAFTSS